MSIKQHSRLWSSLKAHYLGANDCASILGHGFNTVDEVIQSKIIGLPIEASPEQQIRMDHGTRCEPLVRQLCSTRKGLQITETGMRFHSNPTLKFLTASPDGVYINEQGEKVLTEFKVLGELSDGKIPHKYWIQMQIQMEVWDINQCLYCENVVTDDGILQDYSEHLVFRDKEWFAGVLPVIKEAWSKIEDERRMERHRHGLTLRKREAGELNLTLTLPVITGSMLVNYVRHDPLLDWLEKYGDPELRDKGSLKFFTMRNRLSNQFAALVRSHIKEKFPSLVYDVDVCPAAPTFVQADQIKVHPTAVVKTLKAIESRIPIILNACFQIKEEESVSPFILQDRADILVLNSYLPVVFNCNFTSNSSPDLYSVAQINYSKLDLLVDGIQLASNDKQRAYGVKTWFLSRLLGLVQGQMPDNGYIIGASYRYGGTKNTNAFGHIATVPLDSSSVLEWQQALEWQIRLQTDGARGERPYPNMKNHSDFPWHNYKLNLAKQFKEITMMYRCGPKMRKRANDIGITQWSELTPDVFKTPKATSVGMAFLSAQTECTVNMMEIQTKIRSCLPEKHRIRFYLDFESTGSMYDDFSTFPEAGHSRNLIFLIGVIAEDRQTGETEYFSYIADTLDSASEIAILGRMFTEMSSWTNTRCSQQTELPFYYWGDAERQMMLQALGEERLKSLNLYLVDMCKMFREAQIILPGQFSYGLKEVAKIMKSYGMINVSWDEESTISNGLDAMVEAIRVYKFKRVSSDAADAPSAAPSASLFFKEVVRYNYIDCKVMQEMGRGPAFP